MIVYKDRTFCPFYLTCRIAWNCERPLTPEVKDAAVNMGLPVSVFVDTPACHEPFRKEDK